MQALEEQRGHRMLASVEAAKITCSLSGNPTAVDLHFLETSLAPTLDATVMQEALQQAIALVVQCALACVKASGLDEVDVVYLTGGSSALRPLVHALQTAMPQAHLVQGNPFGGVAAGLAVVGAARA
jgi:hypothetical chaperone protein